MMAGHWTWIFQANPNQWDARRCLREQPGLFWKVAAYKNDINVGDTVYLWESGKDASILAACTVTSRPRMQPADPKYAPYMKDKKYMQDMVRARMTVDVVLESPLSREELVSHKLLADLLPIGGAAAGRQGTNFSVPPAAAELLTDLVAGRVGTKPASSLMVGPIRGADNAHVVAPLSLRRAEPTDAPTVTSWLAVDSDQRAGSPQGWNELFSLARIPVYVATRDGRPVGALWMQVSELENEGEIHVVVAPEARRSGVGRYLIDTIWLLEDFAGLDAFRADVRVDNAASEALMRSAGWELRDQGDEGDPESHNGFVRRRVPRAP